MRQWQRNSDNRPEPSTHPSQDHSAKWWHVPDGQIEDLIRRLNDPQETRAPQVQQTSALRDRRSSSGSLPRGSVRFSLCEPDEDALDRVLQESYAAPVDFDPPRVKEKGSWKVPYEQLLEFVNSAKKVLAMEAEQEAKVLEASTMPVSRTALGNAGGRVVTGQHASTVSANRNSEGNQPSSSRSRNSRANKDLSTRPPWEKSSSMPNLFGCDPKGRKMMKAGACRFEETPIYLSDSKDTSMERVRVSVCGHPYYM